MKKNVFYTSKLYGLTGMYFIQVDLHLCFIYVYALHFSLSSVTGHHNHAMQPVISSLYNLHYVTNLAN